MLVLKNCLPLSKKSDYKNKKKIIKKVSNKMELITKKSSQTYTGTDGKTYNYYNYYIVLPNGLEVPVRPSFKSGYALLKANATLVE